jgi:hypothetical protein
VDAVGRGPSALAPIAASRVSTNSLERAAEDVSTELGAAPMGSGDGVLTMLIAVIRRPPSSR